MFGAKGNSQLKRMVNLIIYDKGFVFVYLKKIGHNYAPVEMWKAKLLGRKELFQSDLVQKKENHMIEVRFICVSVESHKARASRTFYLF